MKIWRLRIREIERLGELRGLCLTGALINELMMAVVDSDVRQMVAKSNTEVKIYSNLASRLSQPEMLHCSLRAIKTHPLC